MSNLDKALSDYTTTICDLLDVEFRKAKRSKIDLGKSIDIADDRDTDTQINTGIGHSVAGRYGVEPVDQVQGVTDRPRPPRDSAKTRRKVKENTTNPLKVMGKLTVLATLVYAVFTFFF